jgi:hypothetical protein
MKNIRIPITSAIKRSVDNPNWGILRNSINANARSAVWSDLWKGLESVEDICRIVINNNNKIWRI